MKLEGNVKWNNGTGMTPSVIRDLANLAKSDQGVNAEYVGKIYGKLYRGMLKVVLGG